MVIVELVVDVGHEGVFDEGDCEGQDRGGAARGGEAVCSGAVLPYSAY